MWELPLAGATTLWITSLRSEPFFQLIAQWSASLASGPFYCVGDSVTCDHQILEKQHNGDKETVAFVAQDVATHWSQAYPAKLKCSAEMEEALPRFFGP